MARPVREHDLYADDFDPSITIADIDAFNRDHGPGCVFPDRRGFARCHYAHERFPTLSLAAAIKEYHAATAREAREAEERRAAARAVRVAAGKSPEPLGPAEALDLSDGRTPLFENVRIVDWDSEREGRLLMVVDEKELGVSFFDVTRTEAEGVCKNILAHVNRCYAQVGCVLAPGEIRSLAFSGNACFVCSPAAVRPSLLDAMRKVGERRQKERR